MFLRRLNFIFLPSFWKASSGITLQILKNEIYPLNWMLCSAFVELLFYLFFALFYMHHLSFSILKLFELDAIKLQYLLAFSINFFHCMQNLCIFLYFTSGFEIIFIIIIFSVRNSYLKKRKKNCVSFLLKSASRIKTICAKRNR